LRRSASGSGPDPARSGSAARSAAGSYLAVLLAAGAAGLVLGVALLAGATLLIHPGPGALATSGFLIAMSLVALAAALWVGVPTGGELYAGRRWLAVVFIFLVAGPFGEIWIRHSGIEGTGLGRALAVLLLLALPAYGVGNVLAVVLRRVRGTEVASLAGGAVGVIIAAIWLIPKFDPGLNYTGCALILIVASWLEGVMGGGAGSARGGGGGDMEGKVVIVTGAGVPGQMGYALAESFLAEGARLVITARGPEVVELARGLGDGVSAVGVSADLNRADEAERVVATAIETFGRLDVVVNTAGGLRVMKPLAETSVEEWSAEIERNSQTAFLMSRAALPALREGGGSIINFASPAGLRARAGVGAYSAAKAAVIALTRALALEEREHGVRVNAIAPGMIDTEQNLAEVSDPESVRWVTRDQIAEVVLFLAGEAGSGVSGETIEVVG